MLNTIDQVLGTPLFWWMKADELLSAAYVILEAYRESWEEEKSRLATVADGWQKLTEEQLRHHVRIKIQPVFFLLASLALENMAKGALVAHKQSLVSEKGLPKKGPIVRHNLVNLLEAIGFQLTSDDWVFVQRLTESLVWAGRYPGPKAAEEWMPKKVPGGYTLAGSFSIPEDEPLFSDLWNRVRKHIEDDPLCPKYRSIPEDDPRSGDSPKGE